jgi:hypothetical protein
MEYVQERLPEFDLGGGNFNTRNARYRHFVCTHYGLKFISVGGDGNCFFEALCVTLSLPNLNAAQLRANVVDLFRQCMDSTQPVFERIVQGIELEVGQELLCSTRRSAMNGFKPSTVTEYIDAVSNDGVWVSGLHWLRAVCFLHDVRIAVVLYGSRVVNFVGNGATTVFLYKTDADTHWDPLVPSAFDITHAPQSTAPALGSQGVPSESSVHGSPAPDKYLCELCNVFILNKRELISQHEASQKHKGALWCLDAAAKPKGKSPAHGSPDKAQLFIEDESSAHGSHPDARSSDSEETSVPSESSVHGSHPEPPQSSVHGSHPEPPQSSVHGRPRRTCRMQTTAESPDPPARPKSSVHGSHPEPFQSSVHGRP